MKRATPHNILWFTSDMQRFDTIHCLEQPTYPHAEPGPSVRGWCRLYACLLPEHGLHTQPVEFSHGEVSKQHPGVHERQRNVLRRRAADPQAAGGSWLCLRFVGQAAHRLTVARSGKAGRGRLQLLPLQPLPVCPTRPGERLHAVAAGPGD